ncbi:MULTISPECIES: hypothetical protein [Streptomyces]|uniref:hypothetical protein n=1 Tax=Streptomyces TaxID=1883 RepID=UPI0016706830|nr:hypothetical protein [Streptomyces ruber]
MTWPEARPPRAPQRPGGPRVEGPSYDPAAETRLIPEAETRLTAEPGARPLPAAEPSGPGPSWATGRPRAEEPSYDPAAKTRLIPEAEPRRIAEPGTRPFPAAGTRPVQTSGPRPAPAPETRPLPAAETRPLPLPETSPLQPFAEAESPRNPGRHRAEAPDTGRPGTPDPHRAGSPAAHRADGPTAHRAGSPAPHRADGPTAHGAETPTAHRAGSPAPHRADGPTAHGAETPTAHRAGSPAPHRAETPSAPSAGKSAPQPSGWPDVPKGKRADARAGRAAAGRAFVDPDTRQLRLRPTAPRSPLDADLGEQPGNGTGAGDAGHTHDPHEVTVQMDVVGPQMEDWLVRQAKGAPGGGDSDGPVFVDESGRRRGVLRRLGILVGVACAVFAVVIVATLMSGDSNAPWLPVEGQDGDRPAGQADTSPQPTEPADPTAAEDVSPRTDPAETAGTVPAPRSSAVVVAPSDSVPDPQVPTGLVPSAGEETDPQPTDSAPVTGVLPTGPSTAEPPDPAGSPVSSPGTTDGLPADEAPADELAAGDRSRTAAGGPASRAPYEPRTLAHPAASPDSTPPENVI